MTPETRDRLAVLLEKHLEGALPEAEAAELARVLEGSDEALRLYLETVDLHVDLGNRLGEERAVARVRRPRFRAQRGATWPRWAAAGVLLAAALAGALVLGRPAPAPAPVAAPKQAPPAPGAREVVARVEGGGELAVGETFRTEGGRAVVLFLDGTRLELAGGTVLGISDARGVHLPRGTLAAAVQAGRRAFAFTTPNAEAGVLGTRLELSADEETTRLVVREGRVRLRGRSGPSAVEVEAGFSGEVAGKSSPRLLHSGGPPPGMALGGLRATYFDDNRRTGRTHVRVEPGIALRLDEGKNELPPVGDDRNFAVIWEGKFLAREEGEYLFLFGVDGQGRLDLGGRTLAADDPKLFHGIDRKVLRQRLAPGWHDLVVQYADDRENSRCELRFVPPWMKPRAGDEFKAEDSGYPIPPEFFARPE